MVTLDVRLNVLRCRADILDTHMLHALSTEAVWFIREIAGSGWGGGEGGNSWNENPGPASCY